MSVEVDGTELVRYGHLRRPRRPGLLGFSMLSTLVGGAGLLAAMVSTLAVQAAGGGLAGMWVGGAILAATLVAIVPSLTLTADGRSGYDLLGSMILNRTGRRQAQGWQGPAGFSPDGACRLPGLAASSQLLACESGYGETFGLVVLPRAGHYTLVLQGAATGGDLADQASVDTEVAHWGGCLAFLGQHRDIVGAQVVIETAPDAGVRLKAAVERARSPRSPRLAQSVTDEMVQIGPRGESVISTRLAITFSAREKVGGGGSRRSRDEMVDRIRNLLPALVGHVRMSGAGMQARALSAQEITDAVRVCFDPSVAHDVEEAQEQGGTGLRWDEAGPMRWVPADRWVRHDRAWSTTWQMVAPPTGAFFSDVLTRVLAPHPEVMRKRVALLYRPHDALSAARAVEADVNATDFEAGKGKRATARQKRDHAAATATSDEEAQGAGLVRFGLAITGTTGTQEQLPRVEAAIRELSASARLRVRPSLGNQAAAFLSTLPIGIVLPAHKRIPDESDRLI